MDTTERVIAVVAFLARNAGFHGVTEICGALGLSKSTAHRILSSLVRLNWVERDAYARKYKLGIAVMRAGLEMMANSDLVTAAVPHMFRLRDIVKETVMLTMRVGLERMYVQQVPGTHELRQTVDLARLYPLWNGAPGEVILAHLTAAEIEIVLERLERSGGQTLASGQPLISGEVRESLRTIRENGFAVSMGKRIVGAGAVAAPIFGFGGEVIGALSIGGLAARFTREAATGAGPLVKEAARNISIQLGSLGERM
jgi:IclR family acetate operon transcriptional repressor